MAQDRKYDLEERLIEFALVIADIVDSLPETRFCNHIGSQLIRCGTSPALNYGEAQAAESRKDFIHKIQVILKELRESRICLKVLSRRTRLIGERAIKESGELVAIFATSVKTAKKNST